MCKRAPRTVRGAAPTKPQVNLTIPEVLLLHKLQIVFHFLFTFIRTYKTGSKPIE